jgi:glutathione synthase/RimK-type ligase-like ATP-grasp enzyme
MVLVVTNRDDLTADWLIVEMRRRGTPFVRFNTEDYPYHVRVHWTPDGERRLQLAGEDIALSDVRAVWFRRPLPPQRPDDVDDELAAWAEREAQEALDGIWRTLDAIWVNHPDRNSLAGCKPEQLRTALRAGFEIPESLITNDAEELRAFASHHDMQLVCKPLFDGWVPSPRGDRVFWTSHLAADQFDGFDELGGEPYLFQALVPKAHDIRVTVIGNEAFAVGIHSQVDTASAVDWRRGDVERLEHRREELPDDLAQRCVDLVAHYGLIFGAIDLARRPDGGYTFFELNPNGQWAWIEQRTGLPLRSRLLNVLLEAA